MTQKTDAYGQQTRNSYDVYGRLSQTQHWAWVGTGYLATIPIETVLTLEEIPTQRVNLLLRHAPGHRLLGNNPSHVGPPDRRTVLRPVAINRPDDFHVHVQLQPSRTGHR